MPSDYEQFLTAFPELAENGKTDIMLIQLPSSVQAGKHDGLAEHDALVGRVTRAIAKATSGNYAALLTGLVGNKNDVELVTMRRRLAAMEEVRGHKTAYILPPTLCSQPLPARRPTSCPAARIRAAFRR